MQIERAYYDADSQLITNATKKKILESAIELFSMRGYSGASIRDIVKEVGIKESSLYKHFKSKEEILDTILTNFRLAVEKILPPMRSIEQIAASMSLLQFLQRGIQNFMEHIDDEINQKVWRILYNELFRHPIAQEIYRHEVMDRTIRCLALVFERMIGAGKMADKDPLITASAYQHASITLILEYNLLKSLHERTDEVERKIQEHVHFFAEAAGPK